MCISAAVERKNPTAWLKINTENKAEEQSSCRDGPSVKCCISSEWEPSFRPSFIRTRGTRLAVVIHVKHGMCRRQHMKTWLCWMRLVELCRKVEFSRKVEGNYLGRELWWEIRVKTGHSVTPAVSLHFQISSHIFKFTTAKLNARNNKTCLNVCTCIQRKNWALNCAE